MNSLVPPDSPRDALTGALTRHQFDDLLQHTLRSAAANMATTGLLVIDIDHFKSVNDSFGHARGDAVLVEAVRRLRESSRSCDILFRFGGDEFVMVLPSATQQQAFQVAARLIEAIQRTPFPGHPPLHLTLSIGVAVAPEDGITPEDLFAAADRRVYYAKRAGRAQASVVDVPLPMSRLLAPERLIERDEPLAVAHDLLAARGTAPRSLAVRASPGAGRTRFLAELARVAASRGYGVLHVRGGPARRARRYAALLDAGGGWPVPHPSSGVETYAFALASSLHSRGQERLLILVDDPSEIDDASLCLVQQLADALVDVPLALIYVAGAAWTRRHAHDGAATVTLSPLSSQGVAVWMRQVLRWEPPDDVVAWVAAYSAGLPRQIQAALERLIASGALVARQDGWVWHPTPALAVPTYKPEAPDILRLIDGAAPLVGRDDEVDRLRGLVASARLVTIVGPGGAGKTRLALQAAAEGLGEFRDGAHFVPLAAVQRAEHIYAAIAAALRLPTGVSRDSQAQIGTYLGEREALLVLDNVEHLADVAPVLAGLLRVAPQLRLLVTSRRRLDMPDERVVALAGLPLPAERAGDTAAVQLFLQRAHQVLPAFSPNPEDRAAIVRICRLLDGLPLGIELAASFVSIYSCAAICVELERSLSFLSSDSAAIPMRHRSLTAVLGSFWQRLSGHERQALAALAVFRGGFTAEAAGVVARASPFFLDALTDKLMLRRATGGRFEMHELLRQYAAEQLRAAPSRELRTCQRHSAYYLNRATAAHAAPDEANGDEGRVELDNLRAAWEWAVAHRQIQRVGASLVAFVHRLIDLGLLGEGMAALDDAVERLAAPRAAAEIRAVVAHLEIMRALLLHHMGDYTACLAVIERAARLLDDINAPLVRAWADSTAGRTLMQLGEREQARACLERAIAGAGSDERLAVQSLTILAHLFSLASDSPSAIRSATEAFERARARGYRRVERQARVFLGVELMFQERHAEARDLLAPVIAEPDLPRDASAESIALANMAQISWELQEYGRAAVEAERAIAHARQAQMRHLEGLAHRVRAIVALSTGDLARAEAELAEALAIFEASAGRRDVARVKIEQSLLAHLRAEDRAALDLVETALAIARPGRMLPVEGHALIHRGHALLALGQGYEALESYSAGCELMRSIGRANRAAEALAGVVAALLALGNGTSARERAVALLAHIERGPNAWAGMYDPIHVCLTVHDALPPGSAESRAARACARRVLAHITAHVAPEQLPTYLASRPSVRRAAVL